MSDRRSNDGGTKLSPQTLIVASLASLTAAIVTSTFWQKGTPITAAITPVIVALASELYSRPAKRLTELGARASGTRSRRQVEQLSQRDRVPTAVPPGRRLPDPVRPPEDSGLGPMRVYRAERPAPIRRAHIRVALATAAIAFLIAAVVLTVPELVFGGSVASHDKTTLFGGARHKQRSVKEEKTQTAPATTAPAPTTTAPSTSTTPTAPPAQTVPQTTTPAPAPTVQGGTPTPSPSVTTPAQTPPGG